MLPKFYNEQQNSWQCEDDVCSLVAHPSHTMFRL